MYCKSIGMNFSLGNDVETTKRLIGQLIPINRTIQIKKKKGVKKRWGRKKVEMYTDRSHLSSDLPTNLDQRVKLDFDFFLTRNKRTYYDSKHEGSMVTACYPNITKYRTIRLRKCFESSIPQKFIPVTNEYERVHE